MADQLFTDYMDAFTSVKQHKNTCPSCQDRDDSLCVEGKPLYERFVRLQDAYTRREAARRPGRRS